jgi:hypothetical protein
VTAWVLSSAPSLSRTCVMWLFTVSSATEIRAAICLSPLPRATRRNFWRDTTSRGERSRTRNDLGSAAPSRSTDKYLSTCKKAFKSLHYPRRLCGYCNSMTDYLSTPFAVSCYTAGKLGVWTVQNDVPAATSSCHETVAPDPAVALVLAPGGKRLGLFLMTAGLFLLPATAQQQPVIEAAVNSGSYASNAPLAPGVIFSVFGTSLTNGTTGSATSTALPTQIAGAIGSGAIWGLRTRRAVLPCQSECEFVTQPRQLARPPAWWPSDRPASRF